MVERFESVPGAKLNVWADPFYPDGVVCAIIPSPM